MVPASIEPSNASTGPAPIVVHVASSASRPGLFGLWTAERLLLPLTVVNSYRSDPRLAGTSLPVG